MAPAHEQASASPAWLRILRPWLNFAARVTDALLDPRRRDKAVVGLLVGFAGLYALYAALSRGASDVHFDVGELVGWWRRPALAYHHPPMAVWVARAWFAVFPLADWGAYLLATTASAVALWICWRLFSQWLDDRKRVVALAMLTMVPLYTFHARIFNTTVVQMAFWAAATLFFLRAFITHRKLPSALAGIAAGGALLGKYWGVFLIAGFVVAALADRRRGAYFRSSSPWISLAAGLLTIAPHAIWLIAVDPVTLDFAAATAQASSALRSRSLSYPAGALAYIIAPLLLFLALRPGRAALVDAVAPPDDNRRLIALVLIVPLLLPPLVNLVTPVRLTALWTIPNWSLLPVVLLGSPVVAVSRVAVVRVVALALAVPPLVVLAAPLVALIGHYAHGGGSQPHHRALAQAIERIWQATSDRPLRLVGGAAEIANGVLFYLPDPATALEGHLLNPSRSEIARGGADGAQLARDGGVLICLSTAPACVDAVDRAAAALGGHRHEVEMRRRYLGLDGTADRYVIVALPPQR